MRSVLVFLIVFGALAFAYFRYWARRAVTAGREAHALFKETGNIQEAARRLYAHEKTPDEFRLSRSQTAYLDEHIDEFFQIYGKIIEERVEAASRRVTAAREKAGKPLTGAEKAAAEKGILIAAIFSHAKEWCDLRNIE